MATHRSSAHDWPALDLGGRDLPNRLTFERGVWGKIHGAATDYRWIAATSKLAAPAKRLENDLALGQADVSDHAATLWRTLGDTSYAVAFYPSRAIDASGRRGFLERQVLEWKRPPETPAAAGALLMLPIVAGLDAALLAESGSHIQWDENVADLDAAAPLSLSMATIEDAIEQGIAMLARSTNADALSDLYASLLAGGRAISLKGLTDPLPPLAMATLLLPLPRGLADHVSIAGWMPSSWLAPSDVDDVRRCWDIVLGGATAIPADDAPAPTTEQRDQANAMARSLLAHAGSVKPEPTRASDQPLQLSLWGTTSSGKTAFLAKLFIDADRHGGNAPRIWEVFPTDRSIDFIEAMWHRMRTSNRFPPATTVGKAPVEIEYIFRHQKGPTLSLRLEDRAGDDSFNLMEMGGVTLRQRLSSADGLVMLFDPIANQTVLEERVGHALMRVNLASGRVGRKDERPIAVCVSKADLLIDTPEDFRRAIDDPHNFVREKLPDALLHILDHFCQNYQLFPISAVGVRTLFGVIKPAVFFDEALEPRICPEGKPFNLMAPFTWLLQELTGIS